ncbi:hypothetical protein JTB14_028352 [Gonioctena quinquepunctata]|nr:hypothetical protein JTB14_028352 [Gonioctena quinquepunctata]
MEETVDIYETPTGRYVVTRKPGGITEIDLVEDTSDPKKMNQGRGRSQEYPENPKVWIRPPPDLEEKEEYGDEYFEYLSSMESDEESESSIASEKHKEMEEILKELREERKEAERKEEFLEGPKKPPRIENQPDKTEQGEKEIKTLPSKSEEEPIRPTTLYPEVIIINRLDEQLDSPEAKESDKKTKKRKDKELAQTDGKTDDSSEDESRETSGDKNRQNRKKQKNTEKDKHEGKRRKIHFLENTPEKVALEKNNPETQEIMIEANSITENRILPIIMGALPKLFELFLNSHITWHCKNTFAGQQHDFIGGESTVTNLLLYQNDIVLAVENGLQAYTDSSKALEITGLVG